MGVIIHEAIIITCFKEKHIRKAHNKAVEIFDNLVSNVVESNVNNYFSFLIGTSGGKHGWDEEIKHKENIDIYFNWLSDKNKINGESAIYGEYKRIEYGNDISEIAINPYV